MRDVASGVIVVLALSGCLQPPPPPAASLPAFHPEAWFKGRMHSSATLKVFTRPSRGLNVQSAGRTEPDGALRLDQAIHWAGGATDHRFWRMRSLGGGRYDVSLTDARGPVAFETRGARAHLSYRDRRGPLAIEQWMDLQADGRSVKNTGVVRFLGVPVARLDEVIEHD